MLNRALKQLRVFHSLSQTELANRLEISNSYLSEIEAGAKTPTLDILTKYAKVFSVPVSAIMYFSENMERPQRSRIPAKILRMLEFISGD